jgi:hypothetical protein
MADELPASNRASIAKTALTIVVPLLSGGAMGALINHYYSNVQTDVTYSVNTTILGAGAATKSVLPNLKLLMGNTELPAVYTHTIEIRHGAGPELDHANIGVTLSGPIKLLGNILANGPDPVHQIACKEFDPKT